MEIILILLFCLFFVLLPLFSLMELKLDEFEEEHRKRTGKKNIRGEQK